MAPWTPPGALPKRNKAINEKDKKQRMPAQTFKSVVESDTEKRSPGMELDSHANCMLSSSSSYKCKNVFFTSQAMSFKRGQALEPKGLEPKLLRKALTLSSRHQKTEQMIIWAYDRNAGIWAYDRCKIMSIWSYDHMIIRSYKQMISCSYGHEHVAMRSATRYV